MKNSKVWLSSILCLMLIIIAALPFASAEQVGKAPASRHTVEIISPNELPTGVVPKKFDTQEEADAYIDQLKIDAEAINRQSFEAMQRSMGTAAASEGGEPTILRADQTASKYKDFNQCGGLHYVRVRCGFTWWQDTNAKKVRSIDSVSSTNHGYTLDSKWTQSSWRGSRIDQYRTAAVTVIGTMKHYLVVEDLIEISSEELTLYAEFRP